MTVQGFRRLLAGREHRALEREYDMVLKCAALLGKDAGEEIYYISHEDDPIPKAPDGSLWMRWEPAMGFAERHVAMMFNAQMSYAIGRAEGFEEAFQIDMWDKFHSCLREAA